LSNLQEETIRNNRGSCEKDCPANTLSDRNPFIMTENGWHHFALKAGGQHNSPMPIDIVILGAGAVVSELYLPALAGLDLIRHTKVVDNSADRISKIAAEWPGLRSHVGNFEQVMSALERGASAQMVIVALPTAFHVDACLLAVAKGYHVLCDKPLALHAEQCKEIFAACRQSDCMVDVNMCRRYLPSIVAMRQALQDDLIGDLVAISVEDGATYGWNPASFAPFHRESGGVLADMGVHYLDLIEHSVGRLVPSRYRDDSVGGVEANAVLELRTEAGIPVTVALSRTRELQNHLVFRGTRGSLTAYKDEFDSCLWVSNSGLKARLTPERPFVGDWKPTLTACFAQKILNFLRAIHERGAPGTSALDAASVIGVIEWAYSHREPLCWTSVTTRRVADRPDLSSGRAVVTGGTGFIGSHLVGRLTQLGLETLVPARRIGTCAEVARYPVSLSHVDVLDAKAVRNALEGARWVFHLAYGTDGKEASRVTVEGTRNVVEAAIACQSECVVVLSSIYVFGDRDGIVDESDPYRPKGGQYGIQKVAMERWCLNRSSTSLPTRIVVLNPSCVFGPGGRTYTQLPYQLAKKGEFCWIEGGRGIANYCFVENLVDAILLAAKKVEAHGQRFIINDGTCTWREFLTPAIGSEPDRWKSLSAAELRKLSDAARPQWKQALHSIASDRNVRDVLKTRMPTSAAISLARRIVPQFFDHLHSSERPQLAMNVLNPRMPIPPDWLSDLFGPTSTRFSSRKAEAVLGWHPIVPYADGQAIATNWLASRELSAPA
jgi:predicted dehydrogenase/nucleoside-diphosphate-sugar epimerase